MDTIVQKLQTVTISVPFMQRRRIMLTEWRIVLAGRPITAIIWPDVRQAEPVSLTIIRMKARRQNSLHAVK